MASGISSAIYTREMADLSGFRQHQVKTKTTLQRKRERTEDFEQTCYVVPDTIEICQEVWHWWTTEVDAEKSKFRESRFACTR